MDEKRSNHRKEVKRHSVLSERRCAVRLVLSGDLTCVDRSVKVLDLSITGMGVESDQPMEPGIAWFKECVYGQKCGYVVWQKKNGNGYRVGIEFISLSRREEEYLREQLEQVVQGMSVDDPERLIPKVIEYVSSDRNPAGYPA